MKQFVPFEDDWALAETLANQRLVPYQPGMICARQRDGQQPPLGGEARKDDRKSFAPPSQPSLLAL